MSGWVVCMAQSSIVGMRWICIYLTVWVRGSFAWYASRSPNKLSLRWECSSHHSRMESIYGFFEMWKSCVCRREVNVKFKHWENTVTWWNKLWSLCWWILSGNHYFTTEPYVLCHIVVAWGFLKNGKTRLDSPVFTLNHENDSSLKDVFCGIGWLRLADGWWDGSHANDLK